MNQEYLVRTVVSLGFLTVGTAGTLVLSNPGLTGICLAASYMSFRSAEKVSNLRGKTDVIKVLNSFTPNLIEFSGLALTAFFSPQILLSVAVTGLVGFTECFQAQSDRKLSLNGFSLFERRERVLVVSSVFLLSFFNIYWMFYGLILFSALVLADLGYSLFNVLRAEL